MEGRPRFSCTKLLASLVVLAWLARPGPQPRRSLPRAATGRPIGMTRPFRRSRLSREASASRRASPGRSTWEGRASRRDGPGSRRHGRRPGRDPDPRRRHGRMPARRRGRRLWRLEGYPSPSVVDVRDYAGDGSRGILLTTTARRPGRESSWSTDARGGSISLWKDENNFGGHTRFGKLLAGVAGAQVASTSSGQTPPAPYGGKHPARQLRERPGSAPLPHPPVLARRLLFAAHALRRPRCRRRRGDGRDQPRGALDLRHGERPAGVHGAIRADDPHVLRAPSRR